MSGPPALRIVGGPEDGRRIELDGPVVLGRTSDADAVLPDPNRELSRRHARVSVEAGQAVVEDLASTNGTFVNGRRVTGRTPLADRDEVTVGDVTLVYDAARPPAPPGPNGDGTINVLDGPLSGLALAVAGSATIGRSATCELRIDDPEVSREHAKITIDADGAQLHDLRSSNGTYVNGVRVEEPRRLHAADRINIGETTFELSSPKLRPPVEVPLQATAASQIIVNAPALLTDAPSSRKWWTLAVVSVTTFMLLLDMTIVSVALPSISSSLEPSFSELQWVVDAYTLMLAAVLLGAGSFADIFGRKRVLMIGQSVFIAASLASALAVSPVMLDLARGVQGIGGAMMFACSHSLIVQEFPANERGIAFGIFGGVNSLSVAMGPIVGGLLTEGFGWESIFLLNLPIGIAVLVVAQRKVVNLPGPPTTIDWGGLSTFSLALVLFTYGIIKGNDNGWTSAKSLALFGGAAALLVIFVIIERRREHPMFDLKLLRVPTFLGVNMVVFALTASIVALVFFMTTWLQSILGYGPIPAGLRLAPLTLIALPIAPIAGRMVGKIHPRIPFGLGLALVATGCALLATIDAGSGWTVLLPGLLVAGLGLGMLNPQIGATAVTIVPPYRAGMASGANSTARELGVTTGIAALGALLQHTVTTRTTEMLTGTKFADASERIADGISAGGAQSVIANAAPADRGLLADVAQTAYTAGLQKIFIVAGVLALVGAFAGLLLTRTNDVLTSDAGPGH